MSMGSLPVTLPNMKPVGATQHPLLSSNQTVKQTQTPVLSQPIQQKTPSATLTPPVENDTFLSKNKTKIAVGTALLAAAVGLFALVRSGKADKIRAGFLQNKQAKLAKQANKIQASSNEIRWHAMQSIAEVTAFVRDGRTTGFANVLDTQGNVIRKFSGDFSANSKAAFLEEFDTKGTLIRKTNFKPDYYDDIRSIDEFSDKVTNCITDIQYTAEGKIKDFSFLRDVKTKNGLTTIKEAFDFSISKLTRYTKKLKKDNKGTHAKLQFIYNYIDNPDVDTIYTKLKLGANGSPSKIGKCYDLNMNTIFTNAKNNKIASIYNFDPLGELESVSGKVNINPDGSVKSIKGRNFQFDENGKATRISREIEAETTSTNESKIVVAADGTPMNVVWEE